MRDLSKAGRRPRVFPSTKRSMRVGLSGLTGRHVEVLPAEGDDDPIKGRCEIEVFREKMICLFRLICGSHM